MLPPIRLIDLIAADKALIDAHERRDFMLVALRQLLDSRTDSVGRAQQLFPHQSTNHPTN